MSRHADEYRDPAAVRALLDAIGRTLARVPRPAGRPLHVMEVCGGHTHSVFRYGLHRLVPEGIEFVHGPGCPVCVLPVGRIDDAISLAESGAILTTFGDAMPVPGTRGTLADAKARGADVRIVYSPLDALELARANPDREVVHFALGFETTMPATALTVREAAREGTANFSVLCQHVTIPPTLGALLADPDHAIDGLIGPGHVSMVIGTRPYEFIAREHGLPVVVAGFEPTDILQALLMLLDQLAGQRREVENQYARVVPREGNAAALGALADVFEPRPVSLWRGLGAVDRSGVRLSDRYRAHDAERRFDLVPSEAPEPERALCGEVLKGHVKPPCCPLFGAECTPRTPVGALMVSSEGACAAYHRYERRPEREPALEPAPEPAPEPEPVRA